MHKLQYNCYTYAIRWRDELYAIGQFTYVNHGPVFGHIRAQITHSF